MLKLNQAMIGKDGVKRELGLSVQEYRTAKKNLEKTGCVKFRPTPHGTIATIMDTRVFWISGENANTPGNSQATPQTTTEATPPREHKAAIDSEVSSDSGKEANTPNNDSGNTPLTHPQHPPNTNQEGRERKEGKEESTPCCPPGGDGGECSLENKKNGSKPKRNGRFTQPTIEQLKEYSRKIDFTEFDPQAFLDHYEATGWMIGKNRMKNWQATVRTWKSRRVKEKHQLTLAEMIALRDGGTKQ